MSSIEEQIAHFEQSYPTIYDTDWFRQRPPSVQELIRRFPQWRFYRKRESHMPVRVYGVCEIKSGPHQGETRLHAVVGHLLTPINVVDGIDPDTIEMVERWGDDEMAFIRTLDDRWQRLFTEPAGFMHLVYDAQRR